MTPHYVNTGSKTLRFTGGLEKEKGDLLEPHFVHQKKKYRETYEVFAWIGGPKIMEFHKTGKYGVSCSVH